MIRTLCSTVIFALIAIHAACADDTHERVALFLTDSASPDDTCRFGAISSTLHDLRFSTKTVSRSDRRQALAEFGKQSARAQAAMLLTCNPSDRHALPGLMRAQKLNFLFLIETEAAPRGTPISDIIKTKRDDLVIVHARLGTVDNREIFSDTLVRKLRRPYSLPYEILSRTVVSSYYRSRGTIMTDLRGRIASEYILAKPPTEQILDAWSRVQHSKNRKALEAFVSAYPDTLFADLARTRLKKLP